MQSGSERSGTVGRASSPAEASVPPSEDHEAHHTTARRASGSIPDGEAPAGRPFLNTFPTLSTIVFGCAGFQNFTRFQN